MLNRYINTLIINKIGSQQNFIKNNLLLKVENKDRHHFSFRRQSVEIFVEPLLSMYIIEIQYSICTIHQFNSFLPINKPVVNYTMNIHQAKAIRLADYLQSMGCFPVKQQGNSLWYISPFRAEKEPSFKVNTEMNKWFDFGLGKGGNILDLAGELYQTDSVPALLEHIGRQTPYIRPASFSFREQASVPSFQQLQVKELSHPALLRYLMERGIDTDIARRECKELHFIHKDKPYFAIGFENVAGGYEARNSIFKGCIAPKDITHIRKQGNTCYLFEGFSDYLSFLTIAKQNGRQAIDWSGQDYMVLNSVSNLGKATEKLSDYERIHCFFDNDTTGIKAYKELQTVFSNKVRNASDRYSEYKDLNDFLCRKRAAENKADEVSVRPKPKKNGFHI